MDVNDNRILTISFDRPTFLPSYMLYLVNNENSVESKDKRKLQGSETKHKGIKFSQLPDRTLSYAIT